MSDIQEGSPRNPKPPEGLQFINFVRKPFVVQAIEVTEDNISELAYDVGTIRRKANGTPYIQVDPTLVPNIIQVFPGFWVTKLGDNIRCYSRRAFLDQFVESTPDIENWVDFINKQTKETSLDNEESKVS